MNMIRNTEDYIYYIINKTRKHNIDNISRTKAYQRFYFKYPEIKWALLASIVSRNAGWNMTDLYLTPYKEILGEHQRMRLFMTYERANWLIFSDAYPQLILYEISLRQNRPLFHLLSEIQVSNFMIQEWNYFWKNKDRNRLMTSLIINEQNVIQKPVIAQPFFKKKVFLSVPYQLQNYIMLNAVLLPTLNGKIYGGYVRGFTNLTNRITLGKRLASQLFHPGIHKEILDFIRFVEHTGSRYDYEKYTYYHFPKSPLLRTIYPIIDHQDIIRNDWLELRGIRNKWPLSLTEEPIEIGKSYYRKRNMVFAYYHMKKLF
ncbi:DUF2515 family protein [Ornithinibacillus bavariensis]|uniref:DUF2515 family protein n=1 Tax=Ornithinibacillus bavariensis TaxID=545502 RepID=UPI000EC79290|nr:DUF2515 domain-containing protein [Ornithinibacillus sp.]